MDNLQNRPHGPFGAIVMKGSDHIEVVIVTHNRAGHIGPCVESIVAAGALSVIVDNGSTNNTLDIVRSLCPGAKIIATRENRNNQKVGVTGPQQMLPDRSWQRSYGDLPEIWSGGNSAHLKLSDRLLSAAKQNW